MKQTIFILIFFAFGYSVNAQQLEPTVVKPVAFDRLYLLSSPHKPKQVFVVEVQNPNSDLIKVIYFPKTDGFRGGVTDFVLPAILTNKTLWKLNLRDPLETEKGYCKIDNFWKNTSNKFSTDEKKEPILRFRSTQIDADVKFNNLSEMPCMILDSFSK
jgi:hypothetical protein